MKLTFFLSIIFILISCQQPRDRTSLNNKFINDDDSNPLTTPTIPPVIVEPPTDHIYKVVSSTGGIQDTTLPDSCGPFSTDGINGFQFSSSHLGPYNICFVPENNTLYFQAKYLIEDAQVAFFPTNSDNGGQSSVYIGNPKYQRITSSTSVYKFELTADRSGYQSQIINGIMIMKDKSYYFGAPFVQDSMNVDAYLFCANFLAQYGNSEYCDSFKKVGQYRYHYLL